MDRQTVEEMILVMADMVMENRYLREEVARLQKVENEYYHDINKTARENEEINRNIIGTALKGIITGKSDMQLVSELIDCMHP